MRLSRCIIPSLALAAAAAQAQAPGSEPRYRVELIVFAYEAGDPGEEDFYHGTGNPLPTPVRFALPRLEIESVVDAGLLPDAGAETPGPAAEPPTAPPDGSGPATGNRLELLEPVADSPRPPAATAALPPGFRPLPAAAHELNGARQRLDTLDAYRVIDHTAWELSGVDSDRSVALDLKQLGITNPAGTLEVYLRRFLHVAVELEFFDGRGSYWTALPGTALSPLRYAPNYTLIEERNAIRSGELHYIDHPLFGLLIRITPAPESTDTAAAPGGPAG